MLKKLDEGTGNVLGYEIKGKLTEKEFETLSEEFKAVSSPSTGKCGCSSGCRRCRGWSLVRWRKT